MKPIVVYPIPFDAWDEFERYVYRFTHTLKMHPPGCDYELAVVCNWGQPTDEIRHLFYGLKARFVEYNGHGCDIGSAQHVANQAPADSFILALTSRCSFHRPGWLARYMAAREKYGSGIYGAFASWEGGRPHICTRGYAMDSDLWKQYPYNIDTRQKGQRFEVGEWCVTDFVRRRGLPAIQVLWDNEQGFKDWRKPEGIFRSGRQNACLIWDKHTEAYENASLEEKAHLTAMCQVPSYSQHGEDKWIVENIELPASGLFWDVGAHNGISGSNTLLFERMGWGGYCFEPDPATFDQLVKNRPGSVCLQVAAGKAVGVVPFYVNQSDHGLSGLTRPGDQIMVPVERLEKYGSPYLISIDTEGTELDVWEGLGSVRPKIAIIEYKTCDLPSQEEPIVQRLTADGYCMVHKTEHNLIFLLERS